MKWFETEDTVRFNEVDEWGIAWYGHYMAWFEVGRMALLRQFDLMPKDMVELGYIAPVINLKCDFKQPAKCGDSIIIRVMVVKPEIAALIFKFEILRKVDSALLARGETTQVLMTNARKMIYALKGEVKVRIMQLVDYFSDDYNSH
ncbi:Thioesterase superfamily protein [uncultured Desulfobacterium sp.]|uniref:Thioesterase superfamily protein n=1 Tax=uncultured Desulfobacterium sp. TaxID=201089 RepID=A0A445MRP7_9BACT|nr:Thioesterase superfamily protein [uncultured Desulfobacterium sp.]